MERTSAVVRIAGLLGFEAVALSTVMRLQTVPWLTIRWDAFPSWLRTTPAEESIAAMLLMLTTILTMWIAGSTVLYLLASTARLPRAIEMIGRGTLPGLRRSLHRLGLVALGASTMAGSPGPALAGVPPPPVVIEIDDAGRLFPRGPSQIRIGPVGVARIGWVPTAPDPAAGPPNSVSQTGQLRIRELAHPYEVAPGDNLWKIAARHLEAVTGRSGLSSGEIASHWRRVIAANQDRLRSGNPDLIFPGEQLILPSTGVAGS